MRMSALAGEADYVRITILHKAIKATVINKLWCVMSLWCENHVCVYVYVWDSS